MSGGYLRLEHVQVRRAPGIRDVGFTIPNLSSGVNVVFGPNGVGKTTTAAAIARVLWPKLGDAAEYSATVRWTLDSSQWSLDLEAGKISAQCDGRDASPPLLPPVEVRDRYYLALHELISGTSDANDGFAKRIVLESAGGYDVPGAAESIGAKAGPSSATKEKKALQDSRERITAARRAQESLREQEEKLGGLEQRVRAAREAIARQELLTRATAFAKARDEARLARERVDSFAPQVAKLSGHEAAELSTLDEQIANAAELERQEQHTARVAREEMADALPGGPLPAHLLPAIEEKLKDVAQRQREIAELEHRRARAVAARDAARRALGDLVTDEQLREIDAGQIDALASFAHEAETIRSKAMALDAELGLLEATGPSPDRSSLLRGIALLVEWLRAAPATAADAMPRLAAMAAALLAVIASMLLVVRVHPGWASIGALAMVAAILAWRRDGSADTRPAKQQEYERLDLERPEKWADDGVILILDRLQILLAAVAEAERRADQRVRLQRQRQAIIAQERRIDERRNALIALLGVAPRTESQSLVWLVEHVGRWQDAEREVSALDADLAGRGSNVAARMSDLQAQLAPLGYADARDVATLGAAAADLEGRIRRYASAQEKAAEATRRAEKARHDLESASSARSVLLARADSGDADVPSLLAWAAQVAELRTAQAELSARVKARDEAAAELRASAGYAEQLESREVHEIASERLALADTAREYEPLHTELVTIQQLLAAAREAHDLEAALAEEKRSMEALEAAREADVEAVIAAAVTELVQRETRDRHRPDVFHRARQLFSTITSGQYRLDIEDGEPPTFRAFDETTGRGHTLEELSSATRVQLLLAVRVAFVEREEQGVRLPLFLDEALATSDDRRADAIMNAVVALASEGRQVFYLTSQADEVAKWSRRLAERGMPFAPIDLGAARRHAGFEPTVLDAVAESPVPAVPAPGRMDHVEYGRALGVPAPPSLHSGIARTHLWYLVEAPNDLYSLLRLGVDRLGALRNLVRYGVGLVGQELTHVVERVECAATVLEQALELAAVGRGKVVSRSTIEASGVLSKVMLDRVAKVCTECGGDANELLECLERGEVERLNQKSKEALRAFLEQNGHVDERARLEAGEIRARVMSAAASSIERGLISVAHVEKMLSWAGVRPMGVKGGALASALAAPAADQAGESEG